MFTPLLRRLLAVAVAVLAAPSLARADVQILIEQLDGTGSPIVGLSQITTGTPNAFGAVNFEYAQGFFALSGNVTTNSATASPTASLTPSFSGLLLPTFNPTLGRSLRLTVTDDGFASNGQPATLTNTAGVSSGFAGGTVQVDTFSRVLNSALMTTPASSATARADGPTLSGPTDTASASLPVNMTFDNETTLPVASLPSPFAIQQTLIISFTQTGSIPGGATFGGSGGASIVPSQAAIPAPGGLVLALAALPLLGLRRRLARAAA